jgi:hypothetical protein
MAPYGIKSVFVPANLLREEIRVGYQEGGDGEADAPTEEATQEEATVEENPTFEPAQPPEEEETPEGVAEEGDPDASVENGVTDDVPAEDEGTGDAGAAEEGAADVAADVASDDSVEDGITFEEDKPHTGVDAALDQELPNLNNIDDGQLGGYDDMEAFDAQLGGGMFSSGPDVFNLMRTMLTSSATGASMPDLFEDAVYETTIIKGHLDSIAQSLAIIAAKYAGPGNSGADNNGRNRGRGDRADRGDRGGRGRQGRGDQQWQQQDPTPELPETPPAWEEEDMAAAE